MVCRHVIELLMSCRHTGVSPRLGISTATLTLLLRRYVHFISEYEGVVGEYGWERCVCGRWSCCGGICYIWSCDGSAGETQISWTATLFIHHQLFHVNHDYSLTTKRSTCPDMILYLPRTGRVRCFILYGSG